MRQQLVNHPDLLYEAASHNKVVLIDESSGGYLSESQLPAVNLHKLSTLASY